MAKNWSKQNICIRELPEHYRWISQQKIWQRRVHRMKSIRRVYSVSLLEGERFYFLLLLDHVRGPKTFDDILTVHGVCYLTFKQATEEYGLLETDDSISHSLAEAREIQMPQALRRLFAIILIYTNPCNVRRLWDENFSAMVEDYPKSSHNNIIYIRNKLLSDISKFLEQHNKKHKEFDLPPIIEDFVDLGNISSIVDDELAILVSNEDQNCVKMLNADQLGAFNTIKEAIHEKQNQIFFVDGPGGTWKKFLYRALLANFKAQGRIIIATTTSGIASMVLSGG